MSPKDSSRYGYQFKSHKSSFQFDKSYFGMNEICEVENSKTLSSEDRSISKIINEAPNNKHSNISIQINNNDSIELIKETEIWDKNNKSQDTSSFYETCKELKRKEQEKLKNKVIVDASPIKTTLSISNFIKKDPSSIKPEAKILPFKKQPIYVSSGIKLTEEDNENDLSQNENAFKSNNLTSNLNAAFKTNSDRKTKSTFTHKHHQSIQSNQHNRNSSNISDYIQDLDEFTGNNKIDHDIHKIKTIESEEQQNTRPDESCINKISSINLRTNNINKINLNSNSFYNNIDEKSFIATPTSNNGFVYPKYTNYPPMNYNINQGNRGQCMQENQKYINNQCSTNLFAKAQCNTNENEIINEKNKKYQIKIPTEESIDSYYSAKNMNNKNPMHPFAQIPSSTTSYKQMISKTDFKNFSSSFTNQQINPIPQNFNTISHCQGNYGYYNNQNLKFYPPLIKDSCHLSKLSSYTSYMTSSNYNTHNSNSTKSTNKDAKLDGVFKIEDYITGRVKRTTIMVRNIPNRYDVDQLLAEIDDYGFKNKYDCFYLPMDATVS